MLSLSAPPTFSIAPPSPAFRAPPCLAFLTMDVYQEDLDSDLPKGGAQLEVQEGVGGGEQKERNVLSGSQK